MYTMYEWRCMSAQVIQISLMGAAPDGVSFVFIMEKTIKYQLNALFYDRWDGLGKIYVGGGYKINHHTCTDI